MNGHISASIIPAVCAFSQKAADAFWKVHGSAATNGQHQDAILQAYKTGFNAGFKIRQDLEAK